jgi:hypothetical protein
LRRVEPEVRLMRGCQHVAQRGLGVLRGPVGFVRGTAHRPAS